MGYECELCNIYFSSEEEFSKHLSKHNRKELLLLKKLTLLSVVDKERYEQLILDVYTKKSRSSSS